MDYKGVLIGSLAGSGGDFIKNVIRICHKDVPTQGTIRIVRHVADFFPANYDNLFFTEHVMCFQDPPGSLQEELQQKMWWQFGYSEEGPDLNLDLSSYFDGGIYSSAQFHKIYDGIQLLEGQFYDGDEHKPLISEQKLNNGIVLKHLDCFSKISYLKKIINDYNLKFYHIDLSNLKYLTYSKFVDVFTHMLVERDSNNNELYYNLYNSLVNGEHYTYSENEIKKYNDLLIAFKDFGIDVEIIDLYALHQTRDFNGLVDQLAKSYPLDKYLSEKNIFLINKVWDERIDKMKQMGLWT